MLFNKYNNIYINIKIKNIGDSMKYILIITLILTIILTSCTEPKQIDINEFIENYNYNENENSIIIKENIFTIKDNERYIHSINIKNIIITLKENQNGEIIECIICTSKITNIDIFKEVAINAICAMTKVGKQDAITAYNSTNKNCPTTLNEFNIISMSDELQNSIIIFVHEDNKTVITNTLKDSDMQY